MHAIITRKGGKTAYEIPNLRLMQQLYYDQINPQIVLGPASSIQTMRLGMHGPCYLDHPCTAVGPSLGPRSTCFLLKSIDAPTQLQIELRCT